MQKSAGAQWRESLRWATENYTDPLTDTIPMQMKIANINHGASQMVAWSGHGKITTIPKDVAAWHDEEHHNYHHAIRYCSGNERVQGYA